TDHVRHVFLVGGNGLLNLVPRVGPFCGDDSHQGAVPIPSTGTDFAGWEHLKFPGQLLEPFCGDRCRLRIRDHRVATLLDGLVRLLWLRWRVSWRSFRSGFLAGAIDKDLTLSDRLPVRWPLCRMSAHERPHRAETDHQHERR